MATSKIAHPSAAASATAEYNAQRDEALDYARRILDALQPKNRPQQANWGHVGDMRHAVSRLSDALAAINGTEIR